MPEKFQTLWSIGHPISSNCSTVSPYLKNILKIEKKIRLRILKLLLRTFKKILSPIIISFYENSYQNTGILRKSLLKSSILKEFSQMSTVFSKLYDKIPIIEYQPLKFGNHCYTITPPQLSFSRAKEEPSSQFFVDACLTCHPA